MPTIFIVKQTSVVILSVHETVSIWIIEKYGEALVVMNNY